MAQLLVGLVLLLVLSHWDRGNKRKRPDYNKYQMKESLRKMFK